MMNCRMCSKAVECCYCALSVLEMFIAKQTGFAVGGHPLAFLDLCPDCA